MDSKLSKIKNVILVLSGKGGVGKSSVSSSLATSLALDGQCSVGLLDVDLCGPSLPRIFGLDGNSGDGDGDDHAKGATASSRVQATESGWQPIIHPQLPSLRLLSLGFLIKDKRDAVIWRGPKKTAMIRSLFFDVDWASSSSSSSSSPAILDYLIVDSPPGTSDEHLALAEILVGSPVQLSAIIVTTPQWVSLSDVKKEIQFCRTVGIPIAGIIENMAGYVCPNCSTCSPLFSSEGGSQLAKEEGLPLLASIPIDPEFGTAMEGHLNFPTLLERSRIYSHFQSLVKTIKATMPFCAAPLSTSTNANALPVLATNWQAEFQGQFFHFQLIHWRPHTIYLWAGTEQTLDSLVVAIPTSNPKLLANPTSSLLSTPSGASDDAEAYSTSIASLLSRKYQCMFLVSIQLPFSLEPEAKLWLQEQFVSHIQQ